jgi:putative DNA primase/helicase
LTRAARDAVSAFTEAMRARSLVPPDQIISDGKIHRCDISGKRGRSGRSDGAYLLHLDGVPAGGFENWTDGAGWENWRFRDPTDAERAELAERMRAAKSANDAAAAEIAARAREKARRLWASAVPATADHPYLVRKHVAPNGLRMKYGCLLAPVADATGALQSLQFIRPDGEKRLLKGGRVRGGSFYIPAAVPGGNTVCIAEGFATAASIAEATGYSVVVAFNSYNVVAVAEAASNFGNAKIVVAADDDWKTKDNPGIGCALKAARAADALIAIPEFGASRRDADTDFNDLAEALGPGTVRRAIEGAVDADTLLERYLLADPASAFNKPMLEELAALEGRDKPAYERLRAKPNFPYSKKK